jgi:hypothetical protein
LKNRQSAIENRKYPKSIVVTRIGCSSKGGPGVMASTLNQFTDKET